MSVLYDRGSLSAEEVATLRAALTIIPKKEYNPGVQNSADSVTLPIYFYKLRKTEDTTYLAVPVQYHRAVTGELPNQDKDYPEIEYKFTGKLRTGGGKHHDQVGIAKEAVARLDSAGGCTLVLPCGAGKTILSAYLASLYKGLTLVVFTASTLIKSWYATFRDTTNARVWVVGESAYPVPQDGVDVIICMRDRVKNLNPRFLEAVKILVLDEAHLLCTPSGVEPLLLTQPQKIIACTATPERNDGCETMLHWLVGQHTIVRENLKKHVVYAIETGIEHNTIPSANGSGVDWNALLSEIVSNEERNYLVCKICQENPEDKIMVMSSRVDHVDTLVKLLTGLDEDAVGLKGTVKRCRNARITVAGIKKAGTGFDMANYVDDYDGRQVNIIIIATPFKDEVTLQQCFGRARAEDPYIFDLIDLNKTTQNQWKKRRSCYNKHDSEIVYIENPWETSLEIE